VSALIILKQQRFGLGARDSRLNSRNARHHHRDARRQLRLREVTGNALLEIARFAHVEHRAVRIVVTIDTGQMRQLGEHFFGLEGVDGFGFGHAGSVGWEQSREAGPCVPRAGLWLARAIADEALESPV
jgi:hypothetical protein